MNRSVVEKEWKSVLFVNIVLITVLVLNLSLKIGD